jgi:hypothetical protein
MPGVMLFLIGLSRPVGVFSLLRHENLRYDPFFRHARISANTITCAVGGKG